MSQPEKGEHMHMTNDDGRERLTPNRTGRTLLLAALALGFAVSTSQATERSKVQLTATAAEPRAKGKATLSLRQESDGRFDVRASRLERETEYELMIGGVKVTSARSNHRGRLRLRFRSAPRSDREMFLGFDPRGASVTIRKTGDDDALGGDFPDDSRNDGDVICCLPDGGGDGDAECEDRTADECAALGGTLSTATSCLPNPCGATPPIGIDIVCCIPDDSGNECEDRTQAECLAQGGTVVEAASCAANPCAAAPPQDPDIQCCLPDSGGDGAAECEDRTAAECAALGGVDLGPGTCLPNPCADVIPPSPHTPTVAVTCERRASRARASVNGAGLATGMYTARIASGANSATSGPQPTIGDEVEFDFDSDSGDIGAGATPIGAAFIQGTPGQVTGEIRDASGAVVATSTAVCQDR
jgi:hypothetical protein